MSSSITKSIKKQVTLTLNESEVNIINTFLEKYPYTSFAGLTKVGLMDKMQILEKEVQEKNDDNYIVD